MDSQELTNGVNPVDTEGAESIAAINSKVQTMEAEIKSFGQKRAYFMEIYKKKEDEVKGLEEKLTHSQRENSRLETDIKGIREQVNDMKTEHMITCLNKDEEIERLKLMHQEEMASLNMSLQELLNESSDKHELHAQNEKLKQMIKSLNDELKLLQNSLQAKLSKERDNANRVMSGLQDGCMSEKCRQVRGDMKMQLDAAHQRLQTYADMQMELEPHHFPASSRKHKDLFEVVDQEEKMKELEKELNQEKTSRRDLEMYVAVLAKKKDIFQQDVDTIRKELSEALALLDKEKKDHENLKTTWQMANDQFLESQRLLMIDMRRLESVLTEEQQRRVAELQKQDEERESQQKKIEELERQRQEQLRKMEAEGDSLLDVPPPSLLHPSSSHTSLSSADIYGDFERADTLQLDTSSYGSPRSGSIEREGAASADSDMHPVLALAANVLTDDMNSALAAPLPEDVENKKTLDHLKSCTPDRASPAGTRVVTEKQWEKLQEELISSRAKLGRPCDMCKNYEHELQKEQQNIKQLESQLSQSRKNVKIEKKKAEELEKKLKEVAVESKTQLEQLEKLISKADETIYGIKTDFIETEQSFNARMEVLSKEREDVQKQLEAVELENQQLLDMHSKTSQDLLDEQFVEPQNISEAHKLLTDYRTELINAKAAREHIENKLNSQIQLLKDQSVAEDLQWRSREELLNQAITELQQNNARLTSNLSALDEEIKKRVEAEQKMKHSEQTLESCRASEHQLAEKLQESLKNLSESNQRIRDLQNQVKNLQSDLTNSESVQKDFVKLSQQLQIQLEKIRQAETEVRWEYEDDVQQCNSCTVNLSSNREKHHCMHCGKIHCQQCTSHIVKAGPRKRPTRVCNVCHTILVSDATPYFSSDSR